MTAVSRARAFVVLSVLLAINALAFSRGPELAPYVVPPLVLASVLVTPWRPLAGAALLVTTTLIAGRLGVTPADGAVVLAWLPVLYVTGRRVAPRAGVVAPVAALAVTWVLDPTPANLAFGLVLFGGAWAFGLVVQARAQQARRAAAEHATLAAEDRDAIVREVVAVERSRLTADALTSIAMAVDDMRRQAAAARTELATTEITTIGDRGAAAVGELRRMLGLLRTEPPASSSAGAPGESDRPSGRWRADLAVMAAVMILTLTDPLWTGSWQFRPGDLILCLPLALRRTEPFLALVSAAGLHATLMLVGLGPSMGFGGIAELTLLGWAAGAAASPAVWAAGAAFAGAALGHWWSAEPGNLPIGAVWVAGSAFAGWAWRDRDREYALARTAALVLRRQRDAAVEEAVLTERLRIARELHDVTSHAVGVMVTQAGAAAALAPTDPVRARAALEIVESTARHALVEIELLGDVLRVPPSTEGHLEISVRESEAGHRVTVRNSPSTATAERPEAEGTGFGLVGVAERVRLLGGEFSAGPDRDGGFVVEAVLPRSRVGVAT